MDVETPTTPANDVVVKEIGGMSGGKKNAIERGKNEETVENGLLWK